MTTYQVADGFDNEGGFADIDPQPMCPGITPTRRTFAADGTVIDEAPYVEFIFNVVKDVTTYQSILTQFGINAALTNDVTIKTRDETFADINKNGTAIRPQIGTDVRWQKFFPRDVVILVNNLSAT